MQKNDTMYNLKIMSFNTAGNRFPGINSFFKTIGPHVDIFCLQEVSSTFKSNNYPGSLYRVFPYHHAKGAIVNLPVITKILNEPDEDLEKTASRFMVHSAPHVDFLESFAPEGNAMAIRYLSDMPFTVTSFDYGAIEIFALEGRDTNVTLQWTMISASSDNNVVIANVHGIWTSEGKGDTPKRLEQNQRIVKALWYLKERFQCEVVLVGDFNMLPDTKSAAIFEDFGLRNLIREYGITDTRTSLYKKPCRFADYAFVSLGIRVNEFKVLPDEISDHAPLYLDFDF